MSLSCLQGYPYSAAVVCLHVSSLCALPQFPETNRFLIQGGVHDVFKFSFFAGLRVLCRSCVSAHVHFVYSATVLERNQFRYRAECAHFVVFAVCRAIRTLPQLCVCTCPVCVLRCPSFQKQIGPIWQIQGGVFDDFEFYFFAGLRVFCHSCVSALVHFVSLMPQF